MVQAVIHRGRVKVTDPIPAEWEGQAVKITPVSPDDPMPDLEQRLAALHALGPMEFAAGEKELIAAARAELDAAGKAAMNTLAWRER
jgi:hypothetical protein